MQAYLALGIIGNYSDAMVDETTGYNIRAVMCSPFLEVARPREGQLLTVAKQVYAVTGRSQAHA